MVMADFGCSRGGESAWPDGSSASVGRGRYVMGSAAEEGRCSGRLTGHHSINQRLERFYETLKLVLFLQSKKKKYRCVTIRNQSGKLQSMHLCNILLHNVHICTYFTFLISVYLLIPIQ